MGAFHARPADDSSAPEAPSSSRRLYAIPTSETPPESGMAPDQPPWPDAAAAAGSSGERRNGGASVVIAGGGAPCGACKFLRRKCVKGCIFAPYFGAEHGAARFAAVHKIFGASNVSKLLQRIPPHKRLEAVITISYEAQARITNPVYGCVTQIAELQKQVLELQNQLSIVQAQLASSRQLASMAMQQQQQQHQVGSIAAPPPLFQLQSYVDSATAALPLLQQQGNSGIEVPVPMHYSSAAAAGRAAPTFLINNCKVELEEAAAGAAPPPGLLYCALGGAHMSHHGAQQASHGAIQEDVHAAASSSSSSDHLHPLQLCPSTSNNCFHEPSSSHRHHN